MRSLAREGGTQPWTTRKWHAPIAIRPRAGEIIQRIPRLAMMASGHHSIGKSDKMIYQDGDYVATHADPVWRDQSNFVFRVPIESEKGQQRWEQLWWKRTSDTRFSLCCIPFFAYDLALGDEVEVDGERKVVEVTKRSDQWTFRVWFGGRSVDNKNSALKAIDEYHPLMEWSSDNLLALSVSTDGAQSLADALQILENKGFLTYETGRSVQTYV